jgi:hypothetical protein
MFNRPNLPRGGVWAKPGDTVTVVSEDGKSVTITADKPLSVWKALGLASKADHDRNANTV